jgi:hypothetical protein
MMFKRRHVPLVIGFYVNMLTSKEMKKLESLMQNKE